MWWWYQISSWTENKSSRNGKQSKILCYTSWELNKTQIRKTSSHLIKNFRCGVKWQHLYYRICHTKKNWQFKKEMHIIRLYEESANQFLCNTSWQYKQVTISIAQYYVNKDAISCNWDVALTTCMKSTITQYSITLNLNSIIIHSTKMLHTLAKASKYI